MQMAETAVSVANHTKIMAQSQSASNKTESLKIHKRIGSTLYEVHVYFNPDAKETMDSKILRLINNDIQHGKVAG